MSRSVPTMSRKILMLLFVSVFLNCVSDDVLSPDDENVCPTTIKELVRYNITVPCKGKPRKVCHRTKQKSVTVLKYICCLGWKTCNGKCIKETDVCEVPECVNGIYIDKNCICDFDLVHINETHCGPECSEGYYNDLSITDFTCLPKCSEPCVNGICTDFETCTCDDGLVYFNETHCGPECLTGFHYDVSVSNLSCVTDCSQPCVNGICTDIDTCTCEPSLIHFNKSHCGPECPKGFHNDISIASLSCISDCRKPCVNGICTDIDTCTCEPALVHLNVTHCGPKCPKGFHNDMSIASLSCVSDCRQPCVNGICTDIDICTCETGLVIFNETHCGPECPVGFHNDISIANLSCVSDCSKPCVNGICTDIDTCTCEPSLIHFNKTHCGPECPKGFHNDISIASLSCISDCSKPCVNGICTDIDTCTCEPGLVHLNVTHCGPKCPKGFHNDMSIASLSCVSDCRQPCVNGICTDIDICTCETGLVIFNETHCGPECPIGFHNDISIANLSCVSDCSEPCVNGICTDIDTCTCEPGLVHLNETHCGPKCPRGFHNDMSIASVSCVSDCSQPCVNGICTGIDICTCETGLVIFNETHCGPECPVGFHNDISIANLSCVSDCSKPCVNGICTGIDTCTCEPGLIYLNETHCGPKCPKGFHNDVSVASLSCVSDCSKPCVNGICTDFDTCTCETGLVHLNGTHCGPECHIGFHNDISIASLSCVSDCSKPCVNGICTDIDTCTCDPGLLHLNETHCGPKCIKGFHNDLTVSTLSCVSDCSQPCVNSICTDIEKCTCVPGLVHFNETHCGPKCLKGFHNDLTVDNLSCVSDCSKPCVNGICTDIDTCTCESGLFHFNETHCGPKCIKGFHNDITATNLSCVSDCSQPCVNGICTDIDTCTCKPGLVHLNKTHCGPKCPTGFHNDLSVPTLPCVSDCSQPCVNGICTDIDTCTCKSGLFHLNKTHCGPKCPKGFHNDVTTTNLSCVSDCSQPCVNGICTDIDTCTCKPGLVHLNKNHCGPKCRTGFHNDLSVPTLPCVSDCSQPCVNGICTDIDTCTCKSGLVRLNETHCGPKCPKGFHNDVTTTNLSCVSDCSQPCVNGICIDKETCRCNFGLVNFNKTHCGPVCRREFHNDLSSANLTCVSSCSQSCINGKCISFDKCLCNPGYGNKGSSKFKCEPVCNNCINGVCVNPNECFCNKGYSNNYKGICVPVCSKPCVNGYCIAPEICACKSGYLYSMETKSCEATCKPSCINSTCVSHNDCKCLKGYVFTNVSNICKPYCSDCNNGECIKPEVCQCHEGFELLNNSCEQYHKEALSASMSWIPVFIVLMLLAIAVGVIIGVKILKKRRQQHEISNSAVSSTETMGQKYESKYNEGGGGNEHEIKMADITRVSSLDYIEKL